MKKLLPFILLLLTISLISVSGCVEKQTNKGAEITPAKIDETLLNRKGWERTTKNEETKIYNLPLIKIKIPIATIGYRDELLQNRIKKETLGAINRDFATIYVTKVDTSDVPDLFIEPRYASVDKIMDNVENKTKERVKEKYGIKLGEAGTTSTWIREHKAKMRIFEGNYRYEKMSFEAFGKTFTVEGGNIPVKAYITGWDCPENDNKIVAVAMYPSQDVRKSVSKDLTQAISVEIKIHIDLAPKEEKQEIFELIRSVRCH